LGMKRLHLSFPDLDNAAGTLFGLLLDWED